MDIKTKVNVVVIVSILISFFILRPIYMVSKLDKFALAKVERKYKGVRGKEKCNYSFYDNNGNKFLKSTTYLNYQDYFEGDFFLVAYSSINPKISFITPIRYIDSNLFDVKKINFENNPKDFIKWTNYWDSWDKE